MNDIATKLAACFEPQEVKWKPAVVRDGRAMVIAYVDARCVMDRLDHVLGMDGWQDEYTIDGSGSVVCKLSVRVRVTDTSEEWLSKMDVGSQSEQTDDGDKLKAAFSDALKRAAVKFGVGRYLYRLPHQWVDYDPVKRQITGTPRLPAWALPRNQPEGNGQPVVKAKLSQDEHDAALVLVQDWLELNPNLEALNDYLSAPEDFRAIKDAKLRAAVWRKIISYTNAKGWVQDKTNKALFLEPQVTT